MASFWTPEIECKNWNHSLYDITVHCVNSDTNINVVFLQFP